MNYLELNVHYCGKNEAYYNNRGNGKGRIKTDKARLMQTIIRYWLMHLKNTDNEFLFISKPSKVSLDIKMIFENNRRDIDGPLFLIIDALEGFVFDNDNQIKLLMVEKDVKKLEPNQANLFIKWEGINEKL